MMMAPDSSHFPSGALSEETIAALRAALVRHMQDSPPAPDLHESLTALAREARRKSIHAEQLLILLKEIWGALPEVKNATNPREQSLLLQQLVTICIREYYGA
jgi:hypothetical protein